MIGIKSTETNKKASPEKLAQKGKFTELETQLTTNRSVKGKARAPNVDICGGDPFEFPRSDFTGNVRTQRGCMI